MQIKQRKGISLACLLLLTAILLSFPMVMPPQTAQAANTVITVGTSADAQYATLSEALSQASDGDTLKIMSDLTEDSEISLTKSVTLVADKPVKVTLKKSIYIRQDGQLVLGSGQGENNLFLDSYVYDYGVLKLRDGATINRQIVCYDGASYYGEGGASNQEFRIQERATVAGSISGGTYNGGDNTYACTIFGVFNEISGGTFKGSTVGTLVTPLCVQGTLKKISGGEFSSSETASVQVQHGGMIEEISGGTFKSTSNSQYAAGVLVFAFSPQTARINTISGGTFEGKYGLLLLSRSEASKVSVGEISGGTFKGSQSGLQVDKSALLETISGGTYKARQYGLLNVGNINLIKGGVFTGTIYGGVNFPGGTINTIENGSFIGDTSALLNRSNATISTIHNGVFKGGYYGYSNDSNNVTHLEPNLTEDIGEGRYWGSKKTLSGNNIQLPDGYHMSDKDVTLPADDFPDDKFCYLKKSFTLSYDANGGTGDVPAPQTETTDNDEFSVSENTLSYEGKKFVGWNTTADGSGSTYQPGDAISLSATPSGASAPLGSTTLYAQWAPIYSIVYNTDGAVETAPVDENEYLKGDAVNVSDVALTKEGFTFAGWKLNKVYQPGESFTIDQDITSLAQDGALTLTAQWDKTPDVNTGDNQPQNDDNNGTTPKSPSTPVAQNPSDQQMSRPQSTPVAYDNSGAGTTNKCPSASRIPQTGSDETVLALSGILELAGIGLLGIARRQLKQG